MFYRVGMLICAISCAHVFSMDQASGIHGVVISQSWSYFGHATELANERSSTIPDAKFIENSDSYDDEEEIEEEIPQRAIERVQQSFEIPRNFSAPQSAPVLDILGNGFSWLSRCNASADDIFKPLSHFSLRGRRAFCPRTRFVYGDYQRMYSNSCKTRYVRRYKKNIMPRSASYDSCSQLFDDGEWAISSKKHINGHSRDEKVMNILKNLSVYGALRKYFSRGICSINAISFDVDVRARIVHAYFIIPHIKVGYIQYYIAMRCDEGNAEKLEANSPLQQLIDSLIKKSKSKSKISFDVYENPNSCVLHLLNFIIDDITKILFKDETATLSKAIVSIYYGRTFRELQKKPKKIMWEFDRNEKKKREFSESKSLSAHPAVVSS